jgi:hypothetical protein
MRRGSEGVRGIGYVRAKVCWWKGVVDSGCEGGEAVGERKGKRGRGEDVVMRRRRGEKERGRGEKERVEGCSKSWWPEVLLMRRAVGNTRSAIAATSSPRANTHLNTLRRSRRQAHRPLSNPHR